MRLSLPASRAEPLLRKMIAAGLHAADPCRMLLRAVAREGSVLWVGRRPYDLRRYERVLAVGAGKASAKLARALERILGARLEGGLVVVKAGHKEPTRRITLVEAGHPVPDRAGLRAAERLRATVSELSARDLLFVLLSGGASSLLPAPAPGLTLADKQTTTKLLLRSGAAIQDINIVRKHLSRLKGGGLAASTRATIVTLIVSDVIGDDLGSIGSGPTAPDPSTFADAIEVLRRHRIWRDVPASVRRHLLLGRRGKVPETLKPGSYRLRRVQHEIIGNNAGMLSAVTQAARQAGLRTMLLSAAVTGEVRQAARQLGCLARRIASGSDVLRRPCCVVAGGETTVTVSGRGKGGRAQEFAAAAAVELAGIPDAWVAAIGSDGTDGPTDVAGAVVDGYTVARAKQAGVSLLRALNRHDTYPALKRLRCHIRTGPTGTNVNDLYLLLLL
jgi:glycerate-2-kinase